MKRSTLVLATLCLTTAALFAGPTSARGAEPRGGRFDHQVAAAQQRHDLQAGQGHQHNGNGRRHSHRHNGNGGYGNSNSPLGYSGYGYGYDYGNGFGYGGYGGLYRAPVYGNPANSFAPAGAFGFGPGALFGW